MGSAIALELIQLACIGVAIGMIVGSLLGVMIQYKMYQDGETPVSPLITFND